MNKGVCIILQGTSLLETMYVELITNCTVGEISPWFDRIGLIYWTTHVDIRISNIKQQFTKFCNDK